MTQSAPDDMWIYCGPETKLVGLPFMLMDRPPASADPDPDLVAYSESVNSGGGHTWRGPQKEFRRVFARAR